MASKSFEVSRARHCAVPAGLDPARAFCVVDKKIVEAPEAGVAARGIWEFVNAEGEKPVARIQVALAVSMDDGSAPPVSLPFVSHIDENGEMWFDVLPDIRSTFETTIRIDAFEETEAVYVGDGDQLVIPKETASHLTPSGKIALLVGEKFVERNTNGGFRPVWKLVDALGNPMPAGVQIYIVETRTMRGDPNNRLVRRPYRAGVKGDGSVSYDWHWNSGNHLDFGKYKWHLRNYPSGLFEYVGDGDPVFIPPLATP